MFQYAFWRSLATQNNIPLFLDTSFLERKARWYTQRSYELDIFAIQKLFPNSNHLPIYEKVCFHNKYIFHIREVYVLPILKKLNPYHFVEKQFNFDSAMLAVKSGYVEWYFQTEKYFKSIESQLRKEFSFVVSPSQQNSNMIDIIESSTSVSVHVRRWDFVSLAAANNFHGICDLPYYKRAIEYIQSKVPNASFFFFSDDIDWVKENLVVEGKSYYIDFNKWDKSYEDMRLMSLCKHNIIANSSFSWWGARLNTHQNKIVIAPNERFSAKKLDTSDIIPSNWIKL